MASEILSRRPPLWRLMWESVREDRIPLRASALAFQTLTSLLPMLAIALAFFSGPVFLAQREQLLDRLVALLVPEGLDQAAFVGPPNPEDGVREAPAHARTREHFRARFHATAEHLAANLGKIGVVSFLVLLFMAGLLYHTVEETFNAIWKVRDRRPFFLKAALATAFVFWGPLVVALSLALTQSLEDWPILGGYLIPALLTALAFTALYVMVPNARVRLDAALLAGLAGAGLWELTKVGFLYYVAHVAGVSRLYGSLGLVPVLFGWVYLSWLVALAGAELAYITQHHRALVEQWEGRQRHTRSLAEAWDTAQREAALATPLALAAALEIARRFRAGMDPGGVRLSALAEALDAEPEPLARSLERLVAGGLVAPVASGRSNGSSAPSLTRALGRLVSGSLFAPDAQKRDALDGDDPRYLPARDPARCSVVELARACRGEEARLGVGPSWAQARGVLERLEREGEGPLAGLTLADLAAVPPASEEQTPAGAAKPEIAPGPAVT